VPIANDMTLNTLIVSIKETPRCVVVRGIGCVDMVCSREVRESMHAL